VPSLSLANERGGGDGSEDRKRTNVEWKIWRLVKIWAGKAFPLRRIALVEFSRAYRACLELYRVCCRDHALAATEFVNDFNDKATCAGKQPTTKSPFETH